MISVYLFSVSTNQTSNRKNINTICFSTKLKKHSFNSTPYNHMAHNISNMRANMSSFNEMDKDLHIGLFFVEGIVNIN